MKELIELAKEKGFEIQVKIVPVIFFEDGKTINEDNLNAFIDTANYLWMCELQKWLRDEYNIIIECYLNLENKFSANLYNENRGYETEISMSISGNTYEEALEKGLKQSLKLIDIT